MGFMTALARSQFDERSIEKNSTGVPSYAGIPALGSMPTASGMLVSQATAMQSAAVYACVRIRARDAARCKPAVISTDDVGNKTIVSNHELTALFDKPNVLQTWFEFAEQMNVALLLRDNAYAVKLRDWRGKVVQLIPINPDLCTPLEAPDGSIFYNVSRAGLWLLAVLREMPIAVPSEDMLHLRGLTFNAINGISRIALARDAIGLTLSQEQQASRWAGNGARPSGILETPKKLTEEAATRLKTNWENLQRGVQNAGRTAILEEGMKWTAMQLSSVDLEFNAARLMQVKEVARFFDMPLHKIGEMGDIPKATVAELNSNYVQTVVMGDVHRWEERLKYDWNLGKAGYSVRMDETELLRADPLTMMNFSRFGILSGLLSQNEGRASIGFGPKTGKETGPNALLAPVNLAPNGSDQDGSAGDAAGRPEDGNLPAPKV
jgi:HK97 family phage portal protein